MWFGCYIEVIVLRVFSGRMIVNDGMMLEDCVVFCEGFMYFGIEYLRECYCGNVFNGGLVLRDDFECNMKCVGFECNYCGVGNCFFVYIKGGMGFGLILILFRLLIMLVWFVFIGFFEGWDLYGCWVDGVSGCIFNY